MLSSHEEENSEEGMSSGESTDGGETHSGPGGAFMAHRFVLSSRVRKRKAGMPSENQIMSQPAVPVTAYVSLVGGGVAQQSRVTS